MTILHILKWWSNGKKLANFFSLHLSSIKCVRIAIYYCAIWISHPNSVDAPVADSADCTKKMLFSDCKIISQVKICKNNEINTGFSISYIRFFNQRKDSMDHKVTKKKPTRKVLPSFIDTRLSKQITKISKQIQALSFLTV